MFKLKSPAVFFISVLVLSLGALSLYFFKNQTLGCEVRNPIPPLKNHNAACLIVKNKTFLTVLNRSTNAWDFPGGTTKKDEPAQCVAQRETFEETGLVVHTKQTLHQYDNGFILYLCEMQEQTYHSDYIVPVLARLEVKDIQWHTVDDIKASTWRFPKFWPETKTVIEHTLN